MYCFKWKTAKGQIYFQRILDELLHVKHTDTQSHSHVALNNRIYKTHTHIHHASTHMAYFSVTKIDMPQIVSTITYKVFAFWFYFCCLLSLDGRLAGYIVHTEALGTVRIVIDYEIVDDFVQWPIIFISYIIWYLAQHFTKKKTTTIILLFCLFFFREATAQTYVYLENVYSHVIWLSFFGNKLHAVEVFFFHSSTVLTHTCTEWETEIDAHTHFQTQCLSMHIWRMVDSKQQKGFYKEILYISDWVFKMSNSN